MRFTLISIAICSTLTGATAAFSQTSIAPATVPPTTTTPVLPLASFDGPQANTLNPAWRLAGLPESKAVPLSRFELITLGDESVLQVSTNTSYGVLSHAWNGPAPTELAWRWRVDQPLADADIATKGGDDAALKVCVMFDQPIADIPFFQRASLVLARAATGQKLPSATLCYLWDKRYPENTRGANPYTARVRYIVLDGQATQPGQWRDQRRRVSDDFLALFGRESRTVPNVMMVAVGADSDNTHGLSLAYLSQLRWVP